MSEYSPGSWNLAERTMQMNVQQAHREADAQRLRRQARAAQGKSRAFYFTFLATVGRRLALWGQRLQERYSHETTARATRSAGSQASS